MPVLIIGTYGEEKSRGKYSVKLIFLQVSDIL